MLERAVTQTHNLSTDCLYVLNNLPSYIKEQIDHQKLNISNNTYIRNFGKTHKYLKYLNFKKIMTLGEVSEELKSLAGNDDAKTDFDLNSNLLPNVNPNIYLLSQVLGFQDGSAYKYVNSWFSCAVNQVYLEYCQKNNITPEGLIIISFQPLYKIYNLATSGFYETRYIIQYINYILSKYINSKGEVFFDGIKMPDDNKSYVEQYGNKYKYLKHIAFDNSMSLEEVTSELKSLSKDDFSCIDTLYDKTLVDDIKPSIGELLHFLEFNPKEYIASHYINSWFKCVLNQAYLEYCTRKNITSKGIISIPEHLIKEFYEELECRDCSPSDDNDIKAINELLGKYIEPNGKVHLDCFSKSLQNSLKKVDNIIPVNPKVLRKKNRYTPITFKDYRSFEPFCFDFSDQIKSVSLFLLAEITLSERIISTIIPPKYRRNATIKNIYKDDGRAYYDAKVNGIDLYLTNDDIPTRADTITHEYLHSVMYFEKNKKLAHAVCDLIYEITKGGEIRKLCEIDKKYYPNEDYRAVTNGWDTHPYMTKIYSPYIEYNSSSELLPCLLGNLASTLNINWAIEIGNAVSLHDIDEINKSNFRQVLGTAVDFVMPQVLDEIRYNFMILCGHQPELGAFLLNFLDGKY